MIRTLLLLLSSVITADGNRITVDGTTLTIAPAPFVEIHDESYTLSSDKPLTWAKGTHLTACLFADGHGTVIPGCLVPNSLTLKLQDGTLMSEGTDYLLDTTWGALGRLETGRIAKDAKVLISYRASKMRLDAIVRSPDGKVSLIPGESRKTSPKPPMIDTGLTHVANVFMPHNATIVEPWQIFPVGAPFPEPDDAEIAKRAALVPKTLAKLRAGDPLTIVTWGDSVTCGGDATPGNSFPDRFARELGQRFPKSKITLVNAGIGGTTSTMRLPGFEKDVLAHKPDLVTIEFVNDMGHPEASLRKNYSKVFSDLKNINAEIILITPHFTLPSAMNKPHPRGGENRPTVDLLRKIAAENNIALADTSLRWAHLDEEGIPYITLLENGINHPDDRGHNLFVKDLLTYFPAP